MLCNHKHFIYMTSEELVKFAMSDEVHTLNEKELHKLVLLLAVRYRDACELNNELTKLP